MLKDLDHTTLSCEIERIGGKHTWIQYGDSDSCRRRLNDYQIIYIAYNSISDSKDTSYVEQLIRPYNQLKLIEQTLVMQNVMSDVYNNTVLEYKASDKLKELFGVTNDNALTYFANNFKRATRLDDDKFITLIRNLFSEIISKPLAIQMMLSNPESCEFEIKYYDK